MKLYKDEDISTGMTSQASGGVGQGKQFDERERRVHLFNQIVLNWSAAQVMTPRLIFKYVAQAFAWIISQLAHII